MEALHDLGWRRCDLLRSDIVCDLSLGRRVIGIRSELLDFVCDLSLGRRSDNLSRGGDES